jgi:acyl-coenzyme A thioesterase PaaI-like protein
MSSSPSKTNGLTPLAASPLADPLSRGSQLVPVKNSPLFDRIAASFNRQGAMATINAQLVSVNAGEVEIHLPMSTGLSQQHGFLHAGMLTTALDSALGYASATVMPEDSGILTIEFKVNLMAPGQGEFFVMRGWVAKPGKTIVFSEGEALAVVGPGYTFGQPLFSGSSVDKDTDITLPGKRALPPGIKRIATMNATCMVMLGRSNVKG